MRVVGVSKKLLILMRAKNNNFSVVFIPLGQSTFVSLVCFLILTALIIEHIMLFEDKDKSTKIFTLLTNIFITELDLNTIMILFSVLLFLIITSLALLPITKLFVPVLISTSYSFAVLPIEDNI